MTSLTELAKQCGALVHDSADRTMLVADGVGCVFFDSREKFAAFAERIREEERERCARICEAKQDTAEEDRARTASYAAKGDDKAELSRLQHLSTVRLFNSVLRQCAAAIREASR